MKLNFRKIHKNGREIGQFCIYFGDRSTNGHDGWYYTVPDLKAPAEEVLAQMVEMFNSCEFKKVKRRIIMPKDYCTHFLIWPNDGACYQCGMPKELQNRDKELKDAQWEVKMAKLELEEAEKRLREIKNSEK